MSPEAQARELLDAGGVFPGALVDFAPRAGQIRLAAAIGEAIEAHEHLVAEAGTGIGKTFAYLAPILAGHRRTIISTATRTLQDQLFDHDLPLAARAMGRPRDIAVLKGRDNYLCRERWLRLGDDWVGFEGMRLDRAALAGWVRTTEVGDLAELRVLGEHSGLRRLLTTSAEACQGVECPEYDGCHVYKARRRAQAAEVVIVNHHLLLADLRLKHEGLSEGLLGPADAVVVDEAHALPEIARNVAGEALSQAQLKELAGDAGRMFGGVSDVREAILELTSAFESWNALPQVGRYAWSQVAECLGPCVETAGAALDRLEVALSILPDAAPLAARTRVCASRLAALTGGEAEEADFRWVEVGPKGQLSFHSSPLEPGATLAEWISESGASWIFTSATLAVAGHLDNFTRQIGLDVSRCLVEESPFDYARQALLYLPRGLPAVNDDAYTEGVIAAAEPLLRAAAGGSFLLFTNRKALRRAARLLRLWGLDKPLFVQGEAPQARLLEDFRVAGNGILCGTASFWKGVDVKGDALELVVIDRLPFAWPEDPLFKARLAHCRDSGGVPFRDIQIPEAVLALKQGAGRLIRDGADRGVLAICDPRLQTQGYARAFLDSLPPMPVEQDVEKAVSFLAGERAQ
ncbi:MAG: ATP-dependent DNA helicase [Gammaproteobacteria bacterium]